MKKGKTYYNTTNSILRGHEQVLRARGLKNSFNQPETTTLQHITHYRYIVHVLTEVGWHTTDKKTAAYPQGQGCCL